jgi:hypothetical protein
VIEAPCRRPLPPLPPPLSVHGHTQAAEARSNAVSKRLGEKLLAGWTMLDTTCDAGCGVPLMRSRPPNPITLCVSCDMGPAPVPLAQATPTAKAPRASVTTSLQSGEEGVGRCVLLRCGVLCPPPLLPSLPRTAQTLPIRS